MSTVLTAQGRTKPQADSQIKEITTRNDEAAPDDCEAPPRVYEEALHLHEKHLKEYHSKKSGHGEPF